MKTRLEEIKERCEKATPGPWELQKPFEDVTEDGYEKIGPVSSCDGCSVVDKDDDAYFIAHSRNDIPWLISQLEQGHQLHEADNRRIRELEGKLEKAIEVIKFYGSGDRWSYKSVDNETYLGQKARDFLEQMKCPPAKLLDWPKGHV